MDLRGYSGEPQEVSVCGVGLLPIYVVFNPPIVGNSEVTGTRLTRISNGRPA